MKKKNYIDPNFDKKISELLPFLVVDVKVDGKVIEFTDEDNISLIKDNMLSKENVSDGKVNVIKHQKR